MNKEEKKMMEAYELTMRRLAQAIESQSNKPQHEPLTLFACWCDWCSKDTVHRSLLPVPSNHFTYQPVAASTTQIYNPPLSPLHVCLCCGNTKFKED